MTKNHLLYIGLNGYAGSGKDTVAKMLSVILNNQNKNYNESYLEWKDLHKKSRFATFNRKDKMGNTMSIAFADKLKKIASEIFAVPIEHFYNNKTNGYINISGNFEYTEQEPWNKSNIITAEDFASSIEYYQHSDDQYWMSIREILVYIGTYILQREINHNIFVNITENRIKRHFKENEQLRYVICTDVRFEQEAEYIREHNGILINIIRSDIQQLNNIAEHDLDEENDYDIILENDGTYEDLWDKVWNMVHENDIFKNEIIQLDSHDGTDNFIRLIEDNGDERIYKVCMEYSTVRASHNEDGSLAMIDPSGGPCLVIGNSISYKYPDWEIDKIFTKTEPFGFYLKLNKT